MQMEVRRNRTLSASETILVVGFGNMGQALVRGWLSRGRAASTIEVVDAMQDARSVAATLGITAHKEVEAVATRADVVVLAVKPNQLATVLPRCTACAVRDTVILSIVAGKTIAVIRRSLGRDAPIVRAMPNTPAAIGKGITALVANATVTTAQRAVCSDLLAAVGTVAWLDDEAAMDAVTAISGSGPAYVFLLIECLEQAALDLGLDAGLARQLALATVSGAGAYAAAATDPPAELRRRVTSPNGTTQAALDVLMGEPGMHQLFIRAARAAAKRSRELATA
jgi:pyrroline-5-carboxylate reductase